MQNEQIDGLAINHSHAPLFEQEWMSTLDAEKNGIMFQDKAKRCVVMDVHQRCLQTWGFYNC